MGSTSIQIKTSKSVYYDYKIGKKYSPIDIVFFEISEKMVFNLLFESRFNIIFYLQLLCYYNIYLHIIGTDSSGLFQFQIPVFRNCGWQPSSSMHSIIFAIHRDMVIQKNNGDHYYLSDCYLLLHLMYLYVTASQPSEW